MESLVRLVIPLKVSGLLHESIEGESLLSEPAHESFQRRQASGELLDVSQLGRDVYSLYSLDLHWVALDAAFGDQKAQKLAGWYPEHVFLWVEIDLKPVQILKGLLEVFKQGASLLRLHHNIIYVDLGISTELLEEAFLHAMLKSGAGISQAERHRQVAESSKWCDEGSLQAVCWVQLDLMVP